MVKADLIKSMAEKAQLTPAQAKAALNAFLKATALALKGGDNVKLEMFGTFGVVKHKERKGVHPKTGLPVIITARKVVKFKPAKSMLPVRKKVVEKNGMPEANVINVMN